MTDAQTVQTTHRRGARPANRLLGGARPHDAAGDRRDLRRVGQPPAAEHRQLDGHEHEAAREPGDPRRRPRRSSPTRSTRTSTSRARSRASCRRCCSRSPRRPPAPRAASSTTSRTRRSRTRPCRTRGRTRTATRTSARERRRGQGPVHDDDRQRRLSGHHADPDRGRGAHRPARGVQSKIPANAGQIEILKSDQLSTAQSIAKGLKNADWFLRVLIALGFGLAIWLAQGPALAGARRVRASGWSSPASPH